MSTKTKELLKGFILCFLLMIVLFKIFQIIRIKENTTTKITISETDSLKSELFILQTNIQRYEIMMDKVKEEDSLLYEKVMFETE
jgi:hypothetical protein